MSSSKIRVVHSSKTIGHSGTDKVAQLFCKYLDPNKFEPFLVYRVPDGNNTRLDYVSRFLDDDHLIPYEYEFVPGTTSPYIPRREGLSRLLTEIQPDIFHVHRSGYDEWPIVPGVVPPGTKIVETNIFGRSDSSNLVDLSIHISEFTRAGQSGPVLWNPIEQPPSTFKSTVDIRDTRLRLGRIGRADNFSPIALQAISLLKDSYDFIYQIVSPCEHTKQFILDSGLSDLVQFISPIHNDLELWSRLHEWDIFAHYRQDGECNSVAIGEAMMMGLPIVSHRSNAYNGHLEQLDGCGLVADEGDYQTYACHLEELIVSAEYRKTLGELAQKRAIERHEAGSVTKKLENIYEGLLHE